MKKAVGILILFIITAPELFAQWTTSGSNIYYNSGNVGIGTSSPLEKLHIQSGNLLLSGTSAGNTIQGTVKFSTTSYPASYSGIAGETTGAGIDQMDLLFYTAYGATSEKMRLMSRTGFLGIGTSSPSAQLHVVSSTAQQFWLGYDASHYASFNVSSAGDLTVLPTSGKQYFQNAETYLSYQSGANQNSNSARLNFVGYAQTAGYGIQAINMASYGTKDLVFYAHNGIVHNDYTTYDEVVRFTHDGKVGIGTSAPATMLSVNGNVFIGTQDANTATYMGSNLLAVNGTAVFVKAKVATYGSSWPDYVFDSSYHMMPLPVLENYIKQNKHLPEVPTEKEVKKDGLDLGANQATLLKKIEELTLIVIKQNKKEEEMESQINSLQKQIKNLKVADNTK